mgnify:CR=1 FL=1
MTDVLRDSTTKYKPLIPGAIDKKTDKRLFYCNYISVGITLFLLLVIMSIIGGITYKVSETVSNTNEVIEELRALLPYKGLAFALKDALCNDTNFTKHYGRNIVVPVCNTTWTN